MGYGIIEIIKNKPKVIALGIVELHKFKDPYIKLKNIYERTIRIIDQYHPDELSIEAPFYGKNVQSMLKLGRAQGVAMAAALSRSLPIFEYSPRKIKQAVTGNGNASKDQVASFLSKTLNIEVPDKLDASDGLAAAICHYYQPQSNSESTNYNSWKDFINKNPKRAKQ